MVSYLRSRGVAVLFLNFPMGALITTFLKSLPFSKRVYLDTMDVKANNSLRKNPMAR
jgi:hypothetical protein